jgi:hypothetical protein
MPSGRHRQHLDAGAGRLGRENDGVFSERLANLAKGFARGARGERLTFMLLLR